ncbi:YlbG family protein [Lentilactobacillus sunkii]|nr:YlbG family protein [Lentilactobacillus sunkii]
MTLDIQPTTGLIVYLHSIRHSRNLKSYGRLYYVSKRMRYGLIYVNKDDEEEITKKLSSQSYVKQVVPSHLNELVHEVEGKTDLEDDDLADEDY